MESGGGGGSRLNEMPPLSSSRVCGEFSVLGERVLRRKRETEREIEREEEEGGGREWASLAVGFAWGADYKAERYSAREAYWAWAYGHLFSLSTSTSRPLFSFLFFVVPFIYFGILIQFLFPSFLFVPCEVVLLRITG